MSAKSTWNAGWDAGHDEAVRADVAAITDPSSMDYDPSDQNAPSTDPGFDQPTWEDGYVHGARYAREPLPAFARTANPYA